MKSLIIIPLLQVVAGSAGYGTALLAGWNPHMAELLTAGIICLLSSSAAILPLLVLRSASQVTVVQAGLAGTVAHLVLTLVLAGVAWLIGQVDSTEAFLTWLLVFYWVSLIGLAGVMIGAIRLSQASRNRRDAPARSGITG